MKIVRNKQDLRNILQQFRIAGKNIAFVPTMGALHLGHLSLIKIGLKNADIVITSIFVNPTQFAANEDFVKYPKTETEDIQKLQEAGCHLVYLPTINEMYNSNSKTIVRVNDISQELCGIFRPTHFEGVATIVTKLFMQVMPDYAIFGEKDYQQLHVIKQLTLDLDIPVKIIGGDIMRETSGLAMSSRNRYLSEKQKKIAAKLFQILNETATEIKTGGNINIILEKAKIKLLEAEFDQIDYLELRDSETLERINICNSNARLLAAVRLGYTRLIDNIKV
jgi:pantoate--beta-alanine ligase